MIREPWSGRDAAAPGSTGSLDSAGPKERASQSLFKDHATNRSAEAEEFAHWFDALGRFDPRGGSRRASEAEVKRPRDGSDAGRAQLQQGKRTVPPLTARGPECQRVEPPRSTSPLMPSFAEVARADAAEDTPDEEQTTDSDRSRRGDQGDALPGLALPPLPPRPTGAIAAVEVATAGSESAAGARATVTSDVSAWDGQCVAGDGALSTPPAVMDGSIETGRPLRLMMGNRGSEQLQFAPEGLGSMAEAAPQFRLPSEGQEVDSTWSGGGSDTLVAGWTVDEGSAMDSPLLPRWPTTPAADPRLHTGTARAERGGAFFAGAEDPASVAPLSMDSGIQKKGQPDGEENLSDRKSTVGTTGAKGDADVANPLPIPLSDAASIRPGFEVAPLRVTERESFTGAPMDRAAVGRAVAAATALIETYALPSEGAASRVVLRFKLGGEDLAVRIALVNGQPKAEFQTVSSAVREAVLREWHASVPSHSPLRAHDPVFTASFTASDGDKGAGQRGKGSSERTHGDPRDRLVGNGPGQQETESSSPKPLPARWTAMNALSVFA